MFSQYSQQLFLLGVFFILVYAIVEVIKNFFMALPDKWGSIFREGLGKKTNKWLSFMVGYGLAWLFDFRFAEIIFLSIDNSKSSLSQHTNYLLIACLLFVGAKWIHKKIKAVYQIDKYRVESNHFPTNTEEYHIT